MVERLSKSAAPRNANASETVRTMRCCECPCSIRSCFCCCTRVLRRFLKQVLEKAIKISIRRKCHPSPPRPRMNLSLVPVIVAGFLRHKTVLRALKNVLKKALVRSRPRLLLSRLLYASDTLPRRQAFYSCLEYLLTKARYPGVLYAHVEPNVVRSSQVGAVSVVKPWLNGM